ncbi:MAG: poly-gamma-glutamate biosynthesis protein PgsC [Alteromonadaceae bacterium]|nr:poly-gamma-glutamate biosynthesis protein PgsC [Alteromonadaceae bacterium]
MVTALTLSIGIGLLVGLLFIELFSLFCGGVIVPGYVAMHLDNPLSIIATLVVSLFTYAIVKSLSSFVMLYGRRQYVAILITAFCLSSVLNYFIPYLQQTSTFSVVVPGANNDEFGIIGFVIPGLIANWYERQGIIITSCTVITGAILVKLLLLAF